jgi:UTP--glucose-1-phosphate uridylyltransferase
MIRLHQSGTQPFHAVRFDGTIFDCGSKLGFLFANVVLALEREDLGPALRSQLKRLL